MPSPVSWRLKGPVIRSPSLYLCSYCLCELSPSDRMCVQFAIENAINYDKCHSKKDEDKLACLLDKATVNIGTLFSKQVEGRISTEVIPLSFAPGAEA